VPVAAAEEIVRALPKHLSKLEVIDGGGHFTWMDAPDRFWSLINEFILSTTQRQPIVA
jgi:pimeloyl-ACP methyl ester carboxylesterase